MAYTILKVRFTEMRNLLSRFTYRYAVLIYVMESVIFTVSEVK